MNALGRYMRKRTNELGFSMTELSRRTGLSRQTLHAIGSTGGRLPEMETVVRIALELAVHPVHLFHLVFEGYTLPPKLARQYRERDDRSIFLSDVTIPDGTLVVAGTRFTKTWDVQNVGTDPWTGRVLRCMDESLIVRRLNAITGNEEDAVPVTERMIPDADVVEVPFTPPGGVARMSVQFTAPAVPGSCVSYWKSFFADGTQCFPQAIGLSCRIRVIAMPPSLSGA
jgi:lambda repressor-like predicted transcriptional regulator